MRNGTANDDAPGEEPNSNPFDPKRLRLPQSFTEGPPARRILTAVQIRKPNRQEFFRVHPDPSMRLETLLLDVKDEGLTYLIDPDVAAAIPGEAVAKILYTTITRHGALLLWPVRLPDDRGDIDAWNAAAHHAALTAESRWVRMAANRGAGTYDVYEALDQFSEPAWPDLGLEKLLEMAFKSRFIRDLDHAVVRRLMGDFS